MSATRIVESARRRWPRFIVLTGLSGSGKSQAMRALEDLGYFCVDNLPTTLVPMLAELTLRAGGKISRAAVVIDVRDETFVRRFPQIYRRLRAKSGLHPSLIFLEAKDDVLVRRFSETRRPHPLAHDRSPIEGIREERSRLGAIRRLADRIIDTSEMTVHELRRAFMQLPGGKLQPARLTVTILSFGFKHGIPVDSDMVFDVRFLPNPHFVPELREQTGRDRAVVKYLQKFTVTGGFLERMTDLLKFLIPQYIAEGKSYLTVSIGCTGGRHRSVAVAEALRTAVTGVRGVRVRVRHRDVATE